MNSRADSCYLETPITHLLIRSSLALFPAIFLLLAYDVIESSFIATNGDDSLILFGFLLPLITLLSAFALAIAVKTNIVLVKACKQANVLIPSLLFKTLISCAVLTTILVLTKSIYFSAVGASQWLMDHHQVNLLSDVLNGFLNYKLLSLTPLVIIWQISTILRATGHYQSSAILLLSWMLTKSVWLVFFMDVHSQYFIVELGRLHFYCDLIFALIGSIILFKFNLLSLHTTTAIKTSNTKESALLILQQLVPAFSLFLLTVIISLYNKDYLGAIALVFRAESLFLILPMVLTAAIPSILGVNYWSGHTSRCLTLLKQSAIAIICVQIAFALCAWLFIDEILMLLCPDCKQKEIVIHYLIMLPSSYIIYGLLLLLPSSLNAIGKVKLGLQIIVIHRLVLLPLGSGVGIFLNDITGLFIGMVTAHCVMIGIMLYVYRQSKTRLKRVSYENKQTYHLT